MPYYTISAIDLFKSTKRNIIADIVVSTDSIELIKLCLIIL